MAPFNNRLICEAKGMWHGLHGVLDQASRYVERWDLGNVTKILTTQGDRLYLHERAKNGWLAQPTGNLNIEKIRTDHIAPANTSAIDTLVAMTPRAIGRPVGE